MGALSLYELDRPALQQLSKDLQRVLRDNDATELSAMLELGDALVEQVAAAPRLVDLFLVPEDSPAVAPLWASLRRISRKRAMTKMFTSSHPSLEGRLRAYDVLRDDQAIARAIDRLLNPRRLPWYLRRSGASCGWLGGDERAELEAAVSKLKPSLTPELSEWVDGLSEVSGDVVAHDGM
jgi:hypothetical protein